MSAVNFFDFSRATQGTFIGKNGIIQTANANVPRFQFDANGNGKGAIIEPAATNLFKYSEDFTNSIWSKIATGAGLETEIIPNYGNIFGLNASKVTFKPNGTTDLDASRLTQSYTVPNNSNYVQSFLIKSLSGTQELFLIFAGGFITVTITETPQLISFSSVCYPASWTIGLVQKGTNLRTTGEFIIAYAQLEQGSIPTSYIKTTSAAVTRNADDVRTTGKIYQIGQNEGSIFAKVNTSNVSSARVICDLYSTPNTGIKLGKTNTDAYFVAARVGGTETANVVSSNVNYQGINKVAARYNATGLALYVNGVQEGSASVNVANVLPNSIAFGHDADGQNHFIEPISGFSLFKRALGNNEMKGLTE